jgi:hypothetical protein
MMRGDGLTRTVGRVLVAAIVLFSFPVPALAAESTGPIEPEIVVEGFDVDPAPSDDFGGALSCWRRLMRVDLTATDGGDNARDAIDLLFSTARGRGVVIGLCNQLIDKRNNPHKAEVEISFVDSLHPDCSDSSDGCFLPMTPRTDRYRLFIRTQFADAATEPTEFVFGEYPGNPECGILTYYEKAAAAMAHTIYHELLHVWFLNAHNGEELHYPTGHGSVDRCEFEDGFLEALGAHAYELAVLEGSEPPPFLRIRDTPP